MKTFAGVFCLLGLGGIVWWVIRTIQHIKIPQSQLEKLTVKLDVMAKTPGGTVELATIERHLSDLVGYTSQYVSVSVNLPLQLLTVTIGLPQVPGFKVSKSFAIPKAGGTPKPVINQNIIGGYGVIVYASAHF